MICNNIRTMPTLSPTYFWPSSLPITRMKQAYVWINLRGHSNQLLRIYFINLYLVDSNILWKFRKYLLLLHNNSKLSTNNKNWIYYNISCKTTGTKALILSFWGTKAWLRLSCYLFNLLLILCVFLWLYSFWFWALLNWCSFNTQYSDNHH